MSDTPMLDALRSLFHSSCPRCGHRSVYSDGARDKCSWPDCDWPDAPRDHFAGLRFNPDGTVTVNCARIERSPDE